MSVLVMKTKKNIQSMSILVMKTRKNIQSMSIFFFKRHVDLSLIGESKHTMLSSKIVIHSCMTIHYIIEENIFVVIVYKFLLQQK